MKILDRPLRNEAMRALQRPDHDGASSNEQINQIVADILHQVRTGGDQALINLTEQLDGVRIDAVRVCDAEIEAAISQVDRDLKSALLIARANIEVFHQSQDEEVRKIETRPGVFCWRENRPIDSVGLYIPGGKAPLISTVLMLGVPAQIAGCEKIVLCSPPDAHGHIHPAILYAASPCGIRGVYKVGGSQASAAMAYGTGSIPRVGKMLGPGNR